MLTAVIVTYNRKELLSQNIEMLLKQTMTVDSIIIVDNCSSDGTYEYLKKLRMDNGAIFIFKDRNEYRWSRRFLYRGKSSI
ncbi:MAG: glycosyltransferase [Blautia sp.]